MLLRSFPAWVARWITARGRLLAYPDSDERRRSRRTALRVFPLHHPAGHPLRLRGPAGLPLRPQERRAAAALHRHRADGLRLLRHERVGLARDRIGPDARALLPALVRLLRPAELRDPHLAVLFDVVEVNVVALPQLAGREVVLELGRVVPVERPLVSVFALDDHGPFDVR